MKSVTKKILALLLAVSMVIPFAACGETTDDPSSDDTATQAVTEGETERKPTVEKKNYNEDFTAIYCRDTFVEGYFFLEEDERTPGNDLDDKVYERMIKVEGYLGVDITAEDGGIFTEYAGKVKNSVNAGDDTYQLVMTHVYIDVATLIIENYFRDFGDFDSLNLEADYWNYDLMDQLSVNGGMYCGYNDFCLAYCYLVGFNKDMVAEYQNAIGNLYEQVRNKTWTLDKLMEYSALVSRDNGDGVWDQNDTYGFSCFAWVPLISFQTACGIQLVNKDGDGEVYIAPMKDNKDKIVELDEMLYNFMNADCTYTNSPFDGKEGLYLKSGRVMFQLLNNYDLVTTKEEDVKIGVLPYPKWDVEQEEYYTLNWNGVLGIPTTVKNEDMVGDVIEMLAYYSEPVTTSFYETLLGSKVADAPEDVEMLNIIWNSQVSDIGLVFSSSSAQMDCLLYAIPQHISAGKPAYATYYKQNQKAAEKLLKEMLAGKE